MCFGFVVTPFVGWKENSGDSSAYLKEIAKIYKNYGYKTEIIAEAVRNGRQISELAEAGIDIVTCGLAVYEASFEHPFTTHGLGIFPDVQLVFDNVSNDNRVTGSAYDSSF